MLLCFRSFILFSFSRFSLLASSSSAVRSTLSVCARILSSTFSIRRRVGACVWTGVMTGSRNGDDDRKTSRSPSSALAYAEDEGEEGIPSDDAERDEELDIRIGESSGPGDV